MRRSILMPATVFAAGLAMWGCSRTSVEPVGDAGDPPMGDTGGRLDGAVRDGAVSPPVCTTVCDPPRLIARASLGTPRTPAAVLDAVVHRGELVIALLQDTDATESSLVFALARISLSTGEARLEVVAATSPGLALVEQSVATGALASRGETLTLVAARAAEANLDFQPEVLVATWDGPASTPSIVREPLTDERQAACAGCFRRGAAVAIGEAGALVGLGGEGVLFLGRVDLDSGATARETLPMPGVEAGAALEAGSDVAGVGLLTVGGLRDLPIATGGPAFALIASASALEAPISLPGAPSDPTPHPWLHDGAVEIARFLRDDGLSGGRLHRFTVERADVAALGTLTTAGGLPPLAMASTPSALLWLEASLARIGESDLRVFAPTRSCEGGQAPTASTVVHLPRPLGTQDPRPLVATDHDGRTYTALLEQEEAFGNVALVVFDLGPCRTGG